MHTTRKIVQNVDSDQSAARHSHCYQVTPSLLTQERFLDARGRRSNYLENRYFRFVNYWLLNASFHRERTVPKSDG